MESRTGTLEGRAVVTATTRAPLEGWRPAAATHATDGL
ncbi:hypothetical protein NJ7G_2490 [Natrinema sp. J7-2]|nr:hypothetical protein NJ7G_2490 [Natrinema sp. J7-2]